MLNVVDEGTGPVIVLLHAYPCDLHLFDAQAAALVAAGWRVVRPDLPGFGQSLPTDEPPSMAAMAEQVLGTLTAIGLDNFVLAGLSMGGYAAMEILRQQGERVRALILMDTKATADSEAAAAVREETARKALAEGSLGPLADAMLAGLLGQTSRNDRPHVVDRTLAWITQTPAASAAWAQRAMAGRPDSLADLSRFEGPALVVMGEEDALANRAEHVLMADALPNGSLVVIPVAGHLSAVERPDELSEALVRFVAGL